jgi:LmbE family N-acetylglucosaminyl deacetylase
LTDTQLPGWVFSRSAAIVAAHPEDEVLGEGSLLPLLHNLRAIIHVTDGAPRRGFDVVDAGLSSWQEYATLRRVELKQAIRASGLRHVRLICLWYPDQEASLHIARIAQRLARLFQRLRVRVVFTHPYEGGHPDHDACAAAVRFACLLISKRASRPKILEFSSYHASPAGGLEPERFLGRSRRTWHRALTSAQRNSKRELLSHYVSQQRVLVQFPLEREPIREVPHYNFGRPPRDSNKLFYENFNWGMTGPRWRRLLRRAKNSLGFQNTL